MGYNPNILNLKVGYKPFRKPLILTSWNIQAGWKQWIFPKKSGKTPGYLQGSNTVNGFLNASYLLEICDAKIDYDESQNVTKGNKSKDRHAEEKLFLHKMLIRVG